MSHVLPPHSSLEHLKKQAKNLLHDFSQGDPAAIEKLISVGSASAGARPKLADAQYAIAREYGFASWAKLKEHWNPWRCHSIRCNLW